jgi:hypothetical protein
LKSKIFDTFISGTAKGLNVLFMWYFDNLCQKHLNTSEVTGIKTQDFLYKMQLDTKF